MAAVAVCWLSPAAWAIVVHGPGYVHINSFAPPEGVVVPMGSTQPLADGSGYQIISDSEQIDSQVLSGTVVRDGNGDIVSFGPASTLDFSFEYLDMGLKHHPDNGTLFITVSADDDRMDLYQRTAGGTVLVQAISATNAYGNAAFVPAGLPNAGTLLISEYSDDLGETRATRIVSYDLMPNGDGTFTVSNRQLYADLANVLIFGADGYGAGGIVFLTEGPRAGDLVVADWDGGAVHVIDIDPATGLPVGGPDNPSAQVFISDLAESGPWGLNIDPVSNNLIITEWISDDDGGQIHQIGEIPEPATCALVMAGLAAIARRRRA